MIRYHFDIEQGSEEWHALRCGILTASEMKFIVTPTLKPASNDKERAHLFELLGQRITQHTEPRYISDDMHCAATKTKSKRASGTPKTSRRSLNADS
jgi:hypothetical protein